MPTADTRNHGNGNALGKWTDHRQAIRETLKRKGKSIYWLCQELDGTMSRNLVYTYLRGECGISPKNLAAINRALGLRFTDE